VTNLLKKAFEEASKLAPEDQDRVAAELLEALAGEVKWAEAFEGSADALAALGDEALAEHRAGRTELLDPDEL
jgi:TolB-like protein